MYLKAPGLAELLTNTSYIHAVQMHCSKHDHPFVWFFFLRLELTFQGEKICFRAKHFIVSSCLKVVGLLQDFNFL